MRTRLIYSGTSLTLTAVIAAALAAGIVGDDYEERLDSLEARVERLEAEVGIDSSTPIVGEGNGQDGEDGEINISNNSSSSTSSSSSSSSSSIQSGSGSFTATYSANADRIVPLELDNGGTYRLTAQASADMTIAVENEGGDAIPDLSFDVDGEETASGTAELDPGNYVLRVESSSDWVVIVTLLEE
jgi:hypothetical protein